MTRGVKPAISTNSHEVVEIGRPPADLGAIARKEWNRIAPILNARRVITIADMGILRSYCTSYGLMVMSQKQIDRDGVMMKGKRHPCFSVLNSAQQTLRLAANELGLSPVSRSRAAMRDDDDADSLLD